MKRKYASLFFNRSPIHVRCSLISSFCSKVAIFSDKENNLNILISTDAKFAVMTPRAGIWCSTTELARLFSTFYTFIFLRKVNGFPTNRLFLELQAPSCRQIYLSTIQPEISEKRLYKSGLPIIQVNIFIPLQAPVDISSICIIIYLGKKMNH